MAENEDISLWQFETFDKEDFQQNPEPVTHSSVFQLSIVSFKW